MIAGYEPGRVAALDGHVRRALEALDSIASSDVDADPAIAAASRLRTVLTTTVLPAVQAIQATDPLARSGDGTTDSTSAWYAAWLRSVVATGHADLSDDELIARLEQLEFDLPYDEDFEPAMDHPFWEGFEQLAIELSVRSSTDQNFADRLVDQASEVLLVPIAVGFARFDPDIVARMLTHVSVIPSAMVDLRSNYQAYGADLMIEFLTDHPHAALDALSQASSPLRELMRWPTLDHAVLGGMLSAAMDVPFEAPDRLDDAFTVLLELVSLANGGLGASAFPPSLSSTLARVTVQYLPFFVTSLAGFSDVHLKGFDHHDTGRRLGTYPEVLDFVGALMRNPAALDILLAAVPLVAVVGAGDNGPLGITPDDVADFVDTLDKASANEQFEEQLKAARDERNALVAVDIAFEALELASSALGPMRVAGVDIPVTLLRQGAHAVVEWTIAENDLGLDDVGLSAFVLVTLGLGVSVLRTQHADRRGPSRQRSGDDETVALAERVLDDIARLLENGASIEQVKGRIDDFGRLVRDIDDDGIMAIVDDPRVLPPDLNVHDVVDLDE